MGKCLASYILYHAVGDLVGQKVHHPLGNSISYNNHRKRAKNLQKSCHIYIPRANNIIHSITDQNRCIQSKTNCDKRCQKHNNDLCLVRADKLQHPFHGIFILSHQRFTSCSESCDRQISL